MNVLDVRGLTVGHRSAVDGPLLLKDLSFSLQAGEALSIIGPSGAGKTLTAAALTGMLPPPLAQLSGEIIFAGELILPCDTRRWRKIRGGGILHLFQSPASAFNPLQPAREQIVETVSQVRRLSRQEALRLAGEALELAGLSGEKQMAYPFQLSGGMRQRVMVALALAVKPRIIIADEPGVGLDSINHSVILRLLRQQYREEKSALIVITHTLETAALFPGRTLVLCDGEIVESGPIEAILDHPRHPYTQKLVACRRFMEGQRGASFD